MAWTLNWSRSTPTQQNPLSGLGRPRRRSLLCINPDYIVMAIMIAVSILIS